MSDMLRFGDVAVTLSSDFVATVEIQRGPDNFFDQQLIAHLADAMEPSYGRDYGAFIGQIFVWVTAPCFGVLCGAILGVTPFAIERFTTPSTLQAAEKSASRNC